LHHLSLYFEDNIQFVHLEYRQLDLLISPCWMSVFCQSSVRSKIIVFILIVNPTCYLF